MSSDRIRHFDSITKEDVPYVGGKGANLGEMSRAGFPVPEGFVITAQSYRGFVAANGITSQSDQIREKILQGTIPEALKNEILAAYRQLAAEESPSLTGARVAAIGYMLAIGFGQGFQPICAMNYGAKQYGRVRKALKITVITGTLMMLAAAAVYAVFAEPLTRLFTANDEVAVLGARIIRFQCISLPFLGVYAYASMFLQNTGKYFEALLVSVLRQGIFYVPLLYILPALFGLDGFLLLQPLADLLSAAIGIWFLLRALREMPAR